MKNGHTLAAILCFAFIFSSFTQFTQIKADSTSFSFTSAFRIISPTNRTYTSNSLILDVSFDSLLGRNINHFLNYSLDGREMGNLSIVLHYPDHFSFIGSFTANAALPELAKGRHTIIVYLSGATQSQLDIATVTFIISDAMPVNELTPPVISGLTIENKSYPYVQPPLNFTVDKAVVWTGYSLDDINSTVADWWNTPESMRNFKAALKGIAEGSHTLVVYAEDTFGNNGTSETVNFVVDTTPPKVTLLSIENKTYDSASIALNFAVNESVSQAAYCLDGKENISIAQNSTLKGLSDGAHNVTVYAWDEAGNVGSSETISFNIKTDEFTTVAFAVVSAASVAVLGVGLFVYCKKQRR